MQPGRSGFVFCSLLSARAVIALGRKRSSGVGGAGHPLVAKALVRREAGGTTKAIARTEFQREV
jgi:hypothetical protein